MTIWHRSTSQSLASVEDPFSFCFRLYTSFGRTAQWCLFSSAARISAGLTLAQLASMWVASSTRNDRFSGYSWQTYTQILHHVLRQNLAHFAHTIFNMTDGILTPCNVARSRHWLRQVTASCNAAYGSEIVNVNSSSGITLQCDTWLWDDMPLNSPKRPLYWNFTYGFHFQTSLQPTCHSVPFCKILSKSDHPRQKKRTSCRFSWWRI